MLNLYYHLDERSALNKVDQSLFYTIYRRDYLPLLSVLVMELSVVKVNYFSLHRDLTVSSYTTFDPKS